MKDVRRVSKRTAFLRVLQSHRDDGFCVMVPRAVHTAVFAVIVLFQALCIGFHVFMGWIYVVLQGSALGGSFRKFSISPASAFHGTIAAGYFIVAIMFAVAMLRTLLSIMRKQQQVARNKVSPTPPSLMDAKAMTNTRPSTLWETMDWIKGFLRIDSEHFESLIAVRELVDTGFETYQCYRMSYLIPTQWVGQAYVTLIVCSCWSSALIHFVFDHDQLPLARLLWQVFDGLTTFVSAIVIPSAILLSYAPAFSLALGDFPPELYADDTWLVVFINHMQIVTINSKLDVMSKLVFAFCLCATLETVKDMVMVDDKRRKFSSQKLSYRSITQLLGPSKRQISKLSSTVRAMVVVGVHRPRGESRSATIGALTGDRLVASSSSPSLSRAGIVWYGSFLIWGAVLLGCHVSAASQKSHARCRLPLRPWLRQNAGCALLELLHANSSLDTLLENTLKSVDAQSISFLIIRNFESLVVSRRIQNMTSLVGLKIQNSTIAKWDRDAAVTNAHHPNLRVVRFYQVTPMDFPPLGLMVGKASFPAKLSSIDVCVSNLSSLPDETADQWPNQMSLSLDHCGFLTMPPVLERMNLSGLSMAFNQIHDVPSSLIEKASLMSLQLSGNPINELPVVSQTSLKSLAVDFTNVTTCPSWLPSTAVLYANNTPMCNHESGKSDSCKTMPDCAMYNVGRDR